MGFLIFLFLLVPLVIVGAVAFGVQKFTHLILQQKGVISAKPLSIWIAGVTAALMIFWLVSSLSGMRLGGC